MSNGTLVVKKIDPGGEIVGTLTHEDERENRLVSDLLFLDDGRLALRFLIFIRAEYSYESFMVNRKFTMNRAMNRRFMNRSMAMNR